MTRARIGWIDDVMKDLRAAGFTEVAWRDPQTPPGQPLCLRPGPQAAPYIMTPWLEGRTPDLERAEDLSLLARTLARFHLIGSGLPSVRRPHPGALRTLYKWPQQLRARTSLLRRYLLPAGSDPAVRKLLQPHGPELMKRAAQALLALEEGEYRSLCRQAARHGSLCHGDSGPKNFVICAGQPHLLDFETLRIDLRVYDLFRLIRLSCRHNGWRFETARSILDGYNGVSPLSAAEYKLLHVWLLFPHKITRLLRLYERVSRSRRAMLLKKFETAVRDERDIRGFLNRLADYESKGE